MRPRRDFLENSPDRPSRIPPGPKRPRRASELPNSRNTENSAVPGPCTRNKCAEPRTGVVTDRPPQSRSPGRIPAGPKPTSPNRFFSGASSGVAASLDSFLT
jgi:hypothetical protein